MFKYHLDFLLLPTSHPAMSAVTANIARRVKEDMSVFPYGIALLNSSDISSSRYYQAQNEAARQRFIAGGIATWHEHQERKARYLNCYLPCKSI
jgi:hypothetical protein